MTDTNSTVILIQNNHTHATEFLIIVSQTVFFVLLFLLMKSALIDRRGMMHNYERIQDEKLQLGAIFFAIFVLLGILMIPLESYEFVHYVIPLTYFIVIGLIIWEINVVYKKRGTTLPVSSTNHSTVAKPFDDSSSSSTNTSTSGSFINSPFGSTRTKTAFDY